MERHWNNLGYCAMCHNAESTADERTARFEGQTVIVPSVQLAFMIHRIHTGDDLTQPYVLGTVPGPTKANPAGTPVHFEELRFPGDRRDCRTCHLPGSFELPVASGLRPTRVDVFACVEDPAADADGYCDMRVLQESIYTPPTAAACTSCHDSPEAGAHAEVMTSSMGVESCTVCHATGSAFGIDIGHALDP